MNIMIIRANALGTPRAPKIAKILKNAEHNVTLVWWDRRIRDDKDKYSDFLRNVNVIKIDTCKAKSNAFYRSLFARMVYLIKVFCLVIRKRKHIDVFHCVDFDSALPVYFIKLFNKKLRYNYDIADFLEEYDTNAPNFIKKGVVTIGKSIQKKAENIILPDKNRINMVDESCRYKVKIVTNAPIIDVKQLMKTSLYIDIPTNKINIIYYGVLSKDRGIQMFIDLSKKLNEKYNFFVAGTGAYLSKVKNSKYIRYLGELEYKECMRVVSEMDLCYVVYDPQYGVNRSASPNKLFECIKLDVPVVVARGTSIDNIVLENKIGYVTRYNIDCIIELLDEISSGIQKIDLPFNDTVKQIYSEKKSVDTIKRLYR